MGINAKPVKQNNNKQNSQLSKEELRDIMAYLDEWEKRDYKYIMNKNKPNECIDLGYCDSETKAKKKATEIVFERTPYIPKAIIYANMELTDPEDTMPWDGEPTFIYRGKNGKYGLFVYAPCYNCENCIHSDAQPWVKNRNTVNCKLHNKTVKPFAGCCKDYKCYEENYFGENNEDNPYTHPPKYY